MARSLTAALTSAILPPDGTEIGIMLLEIAHPSFSQTYRVCNNNENITSNVSGSSQVYSAYAFDIALVDEIEGEIPGQHVVIDNTDPSIFEAIRRSDSTRDITITQYFVTASEPNTNQLSRAIVYKVAEIEVDENVISASLVLAVVNQESVPYFSACPAFWPGLFSVGT